VECAAKPRRLAPAELFATEVLIALGAVISISGAAVVVALRPDPGPFGVVLTAIVGLVITVLAARAAAPVVANAFGLEAFLAPDGLDV
jgi:hypothetical protein